MRRLAALLSAIILGTTASVWYFASRGESAREEPVPEFVGLQLGTAEPAARVEIGPRRRFYTSGLQTTVPDTLGSNERTATYALEDGGFRVRVLTHKVVDPREQGIVVQQLPRGGVTRRVGWIVTIFVGRPG